jgi:hypothetical protein
MLEKLAKFQPFEPRRIAPGTKLAMHSNDNLPGFRRSAGRHQRPNPAPVCHWYLIDGRLECRWEVDANGGPSIGDLDHERIADQPTGLAIDAPTPRSRCGELVEG